MIQSHFHSDNNNDNDNNKILNLTNDSNSKILKIYDIYSFPLWYNIKTKKKIYGVQDIKSILEIYAKKNSR